MPFLTTCIWQQYNIVFPACWILISDFRFPAHRLPARTDYLSLRNSQGQIDTVKALANEDTLLWTHCCRHKCFPVSPRAQHLLRTQILCPEHKKCFWFCNILCLQQMFSSLRSPRNIMDNNVSTTMCPRLPGPLHRHLTFRPLILKAAKLIK